MFDYDKLHHFSLLHSAIKYFRLFTADRYGAFGIKFALLSIPFMAAIGVAVDYSRLSSDNSNLQQAVDSAALAAVIPYKATDAERKNIANNYIATNFEGQFPDSEITSETISYDRKVKIIAKTSIDTSFINTLGIERVTHSATAIATTRSAENVCILALNKTKSSSINISGSGAHINTDCDVHANSAHTNALYSKSGATSAAKRWCSVGGYGGSDFNPVPETKCDPVDDPYAGLPVPNVVGCDEKKFKITNGNAVIEPGIYCDGITITGGSVIMKPGLYVMKDGPFEVGPAYVEGDGVTIYLHGDKSVIKLSGSADLSISAPKTGPYAGMVIVQNPKYGTGEVSKINGTPSAKIVGIIYLPTQTVEVGGGGSFGQASPFMSLIADNINLNGNGKITFNYDPEAAGYSDIILAGTRIPYLVK